jgi:hypothetical protein
MDISVVEMEEEDEEQGVSLLFVDLVSSLVSCF